MLLNKDRWAFPSSLAARVELFSAMHCSGQSRGPELLLLRVCLLNLVRAFPSSLAKQIGDSIIASLNTMHQPSSTLPQSPGHQSLGITDPSQLKVIVQSDPKAPPFFRGDHKDTFSIHEWEDMMKCYLGRMKCNTRTEVVDLIMARLTTKKNFLLRHTW